MVQIDWRLGLDYISCLLNMEFFLPKLISQLFPTVSNFDVTDSSESAGCVKYSP